MSFLYAALITIMILLQLSAPLTVMAVKVNLKTVISSSSKVVGAIVALLASLAVSYTTE